MVKKPQGKWPTDYGNVMVMRIEDFQRILVNNVIDAWREFIKTNAADFGPIIQNFFEQGIEE